MLPACHGWGNLTFLLQECKSLSTESDLWLVISYILPLTEVCT